MDLAQTRLQARPVELLPGRAIAYALRPLRIADDCGLESCPMNEFGEPNMGNPSVRFDEGRESVGHWPSGLSIHPLPSTLQRRLYYELLWEIGAAQTDAANLASDNVDRRKKLLTFQPWGTQAKPSIAYAKQAVSICPSLEFYEKGPQKVVHLDFQRSECGQPPS